MRLIKLLDWYILKRFLSTFVFVVLILLAVITVIDVTEKMDKYVEAGVSTVQVLSYYLDYVIWIGSLITPITIFIATVYICARMASHTEIIAILSGGVSFNRLLYPFFVGALLVAVSSFVLNAWIIPNSNKSRLAFELQYLRKNSYFNVHDVHIQVAPETMLYMQSYQSNTNTGFNFTLEKFDNKRLIEKLSAQSVSWDSTKEKWTLHKWQVRKIDNVFSKNVTSNKKAKDTLSTEGDELDTALVIHPKEFENDYRKYDGMTLGELSSYIKTLKQRGSAGTEAYVVEMHTRYASPFSIFILVFLGVIVSSRKSRGGTGLQIALGFLLSFVFLIFFTLFRTFAEAGALPPQISVWIPNIIFAAIALYIYRFAPK